MNIEEIYTEWAKDGEIDISNVSGEAQKVPKLHNKYYKLYTDEHLRLKKLRADYKKLYKLKTEYYRGELDMSELKEHGWQPMALKILRQDIPLYLDSDDDIINMSLRIGMQEEKVDYLESIVKSILNRNFLLSNIINWEKFRTGG